jgi:hypothetical protein
MPALPSRFEKTHLPAFLVGARSFLKKLKKRNGKYSSNTLIIKGI